MISLRRLTVKVHIINGTYLTLSHHLLSARLPGAHRSERDVAFGSFETPLARLPASLLVSIIMALTIECVLVGSSRVKFSPSSIPGDFAKRILKNKWVKRRTKNGS